MSDYLPSNQIDIFDMAFEEAGCSQTDSPGLFSGISYQESQWPEDFIFDDDLSNDINIGLINNMPLKNDMVTNCAAVDEIMANQNITVPDENYPTVIGNITYNNSLIVNQQLPFITNGLDLTGGDTTSPTLGYSYDQTFGAPTLDYMTATQPWTNNLPVADVSFGATIDILQAPGMLVLPNGNYFGNDLATSLPSTVQMAYNVPFAGQSIVTPTPAPQNYRRCSPSSSPEPIPRQPGQKGRPIMSNAQFLHKQKKLRTGELVETAGAKVKYAPPPHSGMSGNRRHICQFCNRRFGNGPRMEDTVGSQHPDSTDKVCVPLEENRDAHEKHQNWLNKSSRKSKFIDY